MYKKFFLLLFLRAFYKMKWKTKKKNLFSLVMDFFSLYFFQLFLNTQIFINFFFFLFLCFYFKLFLIFKLNSFLIIKYISLSLNLKQSQITNNILKLHFRVHPLCVGKPRTTHLFTFHGCSTSSLSFFSHIKLYRTHRQWYCNKHLNRKLKKKHQHTCKINEKRWKTTTTKYVENYRFSTHTI